VHPGFEAGVPGAAAVFVGFIAPAGASSGGGVWGFLHGGDVSGQNAGLIKNLYFLSFHPDHGKNRTDL
jgi:hypothetical protein